MKPWKYVSIIVAMATVPIAAMGTGKAATASPSVAVHSAKRTLSVQIDGPDEVGKNTYCTWQANISGGTPPYSITWTRGSVQSGYGATYTTMFTNGFFHTLKVAVHDAANQYAEHTIDVYVISTEGYCFGS